MPPCNRVLVPCATCGLERAVEPYLIRRGLSKFCGRACYGRSRARPLAERFWKRVDRSNPDSCWEWTGYRMPLGYGQMSAGKRDGAVLAHRVAWELQHGPIPDGQNVLHRCDNPPCVRPDHLFLGTHADNIEDKVSKGRQAKGDTSGPTRHPEKMPHGSQHFRAKLTEVDVETIRNRYRPRVVTMEMLATVFGISVPTVHAIVHGKRWKHVR